MVIHKNVGLARAYSRNDAQTDRCGDAISGLQLPYQERIRLKKLVQRGERRKETGGERLVVGTLNVGSMTGRGTEVVEMMMRRKVDVLCVQETKWKGE